MRLVALHQRRFEVGEMVVLGCTLWSKIPEEAREVVRMKVKDFEKIEEWSVDTHNSAHEADLEWLRAQALDVESQKKGRNVLVVTHHAPCMQETSSPKNVGNAWSSAFATDLLGEGCWGSVKTWVFGHTHYTTEFVREGTRVVSNQRGYVLPGTVQGKSEKKDKKKVFDVRRVIRV